MDIYEGAVQVAVNAVAQAQILRDDDLTGAAKSAIRAYHAAMAEYEEIISAEVPPSTSEAAKKYTANQ